MLVDSSSFQHIPGDMEPSINDRIDEFSHEIKIPEHAQNLLLQDGRYIYIYYDKKKQSLFLQQFPIWCPTLQRLHQYTIGIRQTQKEYSPLFGRMNFIVCLFRFANICEIA